MEYFGDVNIHGDNSQIHLNSDVSILHPFNGLITNDYYVDNIQFGDLLYYDINLVGWRLAKADDIKTLPATGVACATSGPTFREKFPILLFGHIYTDTCTELLQTSQLWLSDTVAGKFTDQIPMQVGHYVQTVGFAKANNTLFYNFCPFYIEIG